MTPFLDTWSRLAVPILEQAVGRKVVLTPADEGATEARYVTFAAQISGELEGSFEVKAEKLALESLPGMGADAVLTLWPELFERIAAAVAVELSKARGFDVISNAIELPETSSNDGIPFVLEVGPQRVPLLLLDGARRKSSPRQQIPGEPDERQPARPARPSYGDSLAGPGLDLLLDVELEASLRFGSREMPLSEIMELGPGDVVQLDRHVADAVDLIVGDKIVAQGEVVLVGGKFGLRVTQVSEPQKRLESIRCLF
jgi:flagellar motor switch protein FliN